MGLMGKTVAQIDTKCNGDVFLGLFRYPASLANIAPNHFQSCELKEGEWGAVGSIVTCVYVIGGKPQACKEVLEAVDENNKSITYRALGGDLMQIYKSLKAIICVEPYDYEKCLVTWTVEYEKINEDVPDPDMLLDLAYKMTEDIETHQL